MSKFFFLKYYFNKYDNKFFDNYGIIFDTNKNFNFICKELNLFNFNKLKFYYINKFLILYLKECSLSKLNYLIIENQNFIIDSLYINMFKYKNLFKYKSFFYFDNKYFTYKNYIYYYNEFLKENEIFSVFIFSFNKMKKYVNIINDSYVNIFIFDSFVKKIDYFNSYVFNINLNNSDRLSYFLFFLKIFIRNKNNLNYFYKINNKFFML